MDFVVMNLLYQNTRAKLNVFDLVQKYIYFPICHQSLLGAPPRSPEGNRPSERILSQPKNSFLMAFPTTFFTYLLFLFYV